MGLLKNAKTDMITTNAQRAWDADRVVFTPLLNMPMTKADLSSGVDDWALMVGGILSVGWKLHTWQVSADRNGRPQATPLFVRA